MTEAAQRFADRVAEALQDELDKAGITILVPVNRVNTELRGTYREAEFAKPTATAAVRDLIGTILTSSPRAVEFAEMPLPSSANLAVIGRVGNVLCRVVQAYDISLDEKIVVVDIAFNAKRD